MRVLDSDVVRPLRGGVKVRRRYHGLDRKHGDEPARSIEAMDSIRQVARLDWEHQTATTRGTEDGELPRPAAKSPLPPLYARWMDSALPLPLEDEPAATCAECVMLPADGEPLAGDAVRFDRTTKCCTFVPNIPNYLVGAILDDADPDAQEGRATVIDRIRSRAAVSPLGLARTVSWSLRYRHNPDYFGRKASLRCPHYLDDGRCGVWKHRESTCATWFCKHTRGVVAVKLWHAVHDLLSAIEHQLAYWCLLELGAAGDAVRRLYEEGSWPLWMKIDSFASHLLGGQLERDPSAPTGQALGARSEEEHRALFGAYAGREEELYVACARRVAPLSFADVRRIVGPWIDEHVDDAIAAQRAHAAEEVPEKLKRGTFELVEIGPARLRVQSYRGYDPRDLPAELVDALATFDGRPVAEALAAIERERGLVLTHALVRRLVDFGILVAPRE